VENQRALTKFLKILGRSGGREDDETFGVIRRGDEPSLCVGRAFAARGDG
jgi:hypothetical protein